MMIEKHLKRGREVKGNIMVIDSSDGAVHSSTYTKDSEIVSYISQLYLPNYINNGASTSINNNILTWMNSLTNKRMETIYPLIIPILEQQKLRRGFGDLKCFCRWEEGGNTPCSIEYL